MTDKGTIQCYIAYTAEPAAAVTAIQRVGGKTELVSRPLGVVQAQIPFDRVDALSEDAAVSHVRLPGYHLTRSGSVTSQGDAVHRTDRVRTIWGLSGAGIKVGVISDGINGSAQSQASGDVPAGLQALSARADGNLNAGAEGLAMLEIVHDLAPGAALAFSNPNTSAEMISAIDILTSTFDCDIICDDIGFSDEPFFQDGPIAARINQAVANGAVYCTSAGNEASQDYYEGDYVSMTRTIGGQSLSVQNFNGAGDWNMAAQVPGGGGSLIVILQWNDPWGTSANDYDLYLTSGSGSVVFTSSTNNQNGFGFPVEIAQYTNNGSNAANVHVVVSRRSGVNRRLKIAGWRSGYFTEHFTSVGSIYGHAAATGAITCGAVPAGLPESIEPFSSRGPVRIDFPSLVYRDKPDLCGVDGVHVTGNGGFASTFYGTSAAAPHVAAVCAQIWSSNPAMSNAGVRAALEDEAVDLGPGGYDTTHGHGRVDAFNAAGALHNCPADVSVSAAPPGAGAVSGAGSYACGDSVTVSAAASAGYDFMNWTENGLQVSTSATYGFTATRDRALIANFSPKPVFYTVSTVASPPEGGTTGGGGSYTSGSTVTVDAVPAADYIFVNWTEGGVQVSTSPNYAFAVNADRELTAHFSLEPPAAAPVIAPGGGTFTQPVQVTLASTTPAARITYTTDGADPTAQSTLYTAPFTLSTSTLVKARSFADGFHESPIASADFTIHISHHIATTASPPEGGSTSGEGNYPDGAGVTVNATPGAGFVFVHWSENGVPVNASASYPFTATGDRSLVAVFDSVVARPEIMPDGGTFTDRVEVMLSSSTPGAAITYTTDGRDPTPDSEAYAGPFTLTESATLKARAFLAPHESPVSVAEFVVTPGSPATYTLTVQGGAGEATIERHTAGASVSVPAPDAAEGERFSHWSGDAEGSNNPISIVMDGDKTLVAHYESCPMQPVPCGAGVPVCGVMAAVVFAAARRGRAHVTAA